MLLAREFDLVAPSDRGVSIFGDGGREVGGDIRLMSMVLAGREWPVAGIW